MASTPEGRRLTEEHRQAQQDVRDDFIAEFLALWVLLDSARLDETGPGWIAAVQRLVRAYRRLSAEVATRYFYDFASFEAPDSSPPPRVPWEPPADTTSRPQTPPPPAGPLTGRPPRQESARSRPRPPQQTRRREAERVLDRALERSGVRWDFDEDAFRRAGERARDRRTRIEFEVPELDEDRLDRAVEVSLTVTGPVGQKSKRGRGKTERQARDESFVESAGAASRHVLTGGRQSLMRLVQDDMRLVGYIRVTDGDPCYFCAMLASRGPVYRTPRRAGTNRRSTRNPRMPNVEFVGDGGFKVHDHCACTVEPVYTTDTVWPGRAREFQQLWNQHIRNRYSGEEAVREWRRVYTRLQREGFRAA